MEYKEGGVSIYMHTTLVSSRLAEASDTTEYFPPLELAMFLNASGGVNLPKNIRLQRLMVDIVRN